MQISAVSNQGFTGKRTNIDNFINQDDKTIRKAANQAAIECSNEKKFKKVNNALWYSIPVAAGISAAVLNKGKSTLFTKTLTGTAAKLTSGLKYAAGWGLAIGVADAIVGGKNLLTKNSDGAKDFEKKHPFIALAGLLAAGMAAITFLPKGLSKLYSKISPKVIGKLAEKTGKLADKINANKLVKSMNKFADKLGKKTPSVVKNAGKTAISWAPDALLFGTLFHTLGHGLAIGSQANQNYNYLKDTQLHFAKARMNELQMENDFLKQFPENEENVKLLKRPLADLPEEIQEKIADLNAEKDADKTEEV